jgi:hypothetical protein
MLKKGIMWHSKYSGGTKEIVGCSSHIIRFIVNNNKLCSVFTSESQRF